MCEVLVGCAMEVGSWTMYLSRIPMGPGPYHHTFSSQEFFIDFRERGREQEREEEGSERKRHVFYCSTYLCIHWLILLFSIQKLVL